MARRAAATPPTNPTSDARLIGLTILLIALGALYLGWSWKRRGAGAGATRATFINLKISGRLRLPAGVERNKVVAHVHLPDIPLDVFSRGAELFPGKEDDFVVDLHLNGTVRPKSVTFSAEAAGAGKVEVFDQQVTEAPNGPVDETNLSCQLAEQSLPARPAPRVFAMPNWGGKFAPRAWPKAPAPEKVKHLAPKPNTARGRAS